MNCQLLPLGAATLCILHTTYPAMHYAVLLLLQARVGHRELRDLCGLMAGQMGRFQTVLGYARRNAEDLEEKVQAAEEELRTLKTAAEGRGRHAAEAEKARAGSQSDRATLAAQLSAARRAAAGVAEAADAAGIELRLAGREAEERQEVCKRLRANASAAMAAKQAIQLALLSRNEEMCGLFEQSAAVQEEVAAGG
jgi:chromosome segregation ATPase